VNPPLPPHDPTLIIKSLSADELRRRLTDLEAERRAVLALLRTVRARDRRLDAEAGNQGVRGE
jgi:hypothetical protein